MPANLENSAVATGLEKVSFHSNHKERQCQRIFKLLHNCAHLTCLQSNAQNSPSQASTVREPWTSRCSRWIRKGRGTRDQIANIRWIIKKEFQKNIYFCFIDYTKALTVWTQQTVENSSRMRIPDHLTCLLRNVYADQEAIFRTGYGTTDWFQIRKGVHQGWILSACLFNLHA